MSGLLALILVGCGIVAAWYGVMQVSGHDPSRSDLLRWRRPRCGVFRTKGPRPGLPDRGYRCIVEACLVRSSRYPVFLSRYSGSRFSFLLVGVTFIGQTQRCAACLRMNGYGGVS